jgi:hypothetical protein
MIITLSRQYRHMLSVNVSSVLISTCKTSIPITTTVLNRTQAVVQNVTLWRAMVCLPDRAEVGGEPQSGRKRERRGGTSARPLEYLSQTDYHTTTEASDNHHSPHSEPCLLEARGALKRPLRALINRACTTLNHLDGMDSPLSPRRHSGAALVHATVLAPFLVPQSPRQLPTQYVRTRNTRQTAHSGQHWYYNVRVNGRKQGPCRHYPRTYMSLVGYSYTRTRNSFRIYTWNIMSHAWRPP